MKKLILFLLPLLLLACSEPHFKVEGTVAGADDASISLEKADFSGRWITVDSTRTSSAGKFSFKGTAPDAPEIYRLSLDGKYIYFPVDSTETVSVNSDLKAFDTDFTLDGSENARAMEKFEKKLIAFSADQTGREDLKRDLFTEFIKPLGASVVSYYILTKTIDGKPLFDPDNDSDARYYGAVATAFKQFRPDDPRTRLLEEVSLRMIRRKNSKNGQQQVLQAEEVKLFDITLPDTDGKERSLSEFAGKGKPVILVFSLMNQAGSPALNAELNAMRVSRDMNIYQVSLDSDLYAWREAARNLPWICVFDNNGASGAAARYNVTSLPTFFIIDSNGDLVDRAASVNELGEKLKTVR